MNDVTRIPVSPVAATPAPAATGAASGGTSFQALLERLQRFAADKPAGAVDSPDELREAMRRADASFTTAMDLRRQLEDAFRRHQP